MSTGKQYAGSAIAMHSSLNILGTATFLLAASGAFIASVAHRYPAHTVRIEYVAGALLVGGLALFGACLKALIG
jgi:hypothetical protein